MLTRKRINRTVQDYIKKHSPRHSRSSIKNALLSCGFDEDYIDGRLAKHSEKEIMKKYLAVSLLLFIGSFFYFGFDYFEVFNKASITGFAINKEPQHNYLAISVHKAENDFKVVWINRISLVKLVGNDNGDYLVRSYSENNLVIEEQNYNLENEGIYTIYVPANAKSVEIYKEGEVIFSRNLRLVT